MSEDKKLERAAEIAIWLMIACGAAWLLMGMD